VISIDEDSGDDEVVEATEAEGGRSTRATPAKGGTGTESTKASAAWGRTTRGR
jgi:hypothetical protein